MRDKQLDGYLNRLASLCDRDANDLDILLRLLLVHFCVLDLMHDVHALDCSSEDGVLVVKPWLVEIKNMDQHTHVESHLQSFPW